MLGLIQDLGCFVPDADTSLHHRSCSEMPYTKGDEGMFPGCAA